MIFFMIPAVTTAWNKQKDWAVMCGCRIDKTGQYTETQTSSTESPPKKMMWQYFPVLIDTV